MTFLTVTFIYLEYIRPCMSKVYPALHPVNLQTGSCSFVLFVEDISAEPFHLGKCNVGHSKMICLNLKPSKQVLKPALYFIYLGDSCKTKKNHTFRMTVEKKNNDLYSMDNMVCMWISNNKVVLTKKSKYSSGAL